MDRSLISGRLLAGEGRRMTEKQRRIVTAAALLFAEQGFAATSTRQIAQKAQVSDGAIFRHFAGKKELLTYISQLIISNVVTPLFNEGLAGLFERHYNRPEDFLQAFFAGRLELVEENILLLKLLLQEAMFQPEIRQAFLLTVRQSQFLLLIAGLKERGLPTVIPYQELAMLILSTLVGFIFSHYLITPEILPPDHRQQQESHIRRLTFSLAWVWQKK